MNGTISHSTVWRLATPIILSNLSVPLVGAVDTAVMGHLPHPAYIGAVALGALVFSFVYWSFSFLRMGTTGFVSQTYGADNTEEIMDIFRRGFLLALLFGALLIIVQLPIITLSLSLLDGSNKVELLTEEYLRIRIWSAPAVLVQYTVIGGLIGLHDTRSTFILQIVLNGINIALDLLFVLVFKWGIAGVAIATLIAEYVAAVVGLWMIWRKFPAIGYAVQWSRIFNTQKLLELFRVNINIFIRTLCLTFSFAWFTAQSTRLGELTLAANAVLMNLTHITAYGLDGFAHAAEALAGSAYGAGKKQRFRRAVNLTTFWASITAAVLGFIYLLSGKLIVSWMTNIEDVKQYAQFYLPWLVVSPLISVWSFQLDGIFIGTTHTSEMRNAMLISTLVFLISVYFLLPLWGNHGLWLALMIFMIARALTLGYWYPKIEMRLKEQVRH